MTVPSWKSQFEKFSADPVREISRELGDAQFSLRELAIAAQSLEKIAKRYPTDKGVSTVQANLAKLNKIFAKTAKEAQKKLEQLSKKSTPPELKKEAFKAKKLIEARLEDPKALKVIPWQQVSELHSEVVYEIHFQIANGPHGNYDRALSQSSRDGVIKEFHITYGKITAKEFAEQYLAGLKGWAGLKGEGAANAKRAEYAIDIKLVLDSAVRRLGFDHEKADVSATTIEASYRSDSLPKEGESAVGEHRYGELVSDEISKAKKLIEPQLSRYKNVIKRINYSAEEKSWVYITVELK